MKSDRRHELQTNELADWLGQHIEKVQPYSKVILGGVILVLALIAVGIIVKTRNDQNNREGWDAYIAASGNSMLGVTGEEVEELGVVATDYNSTTVSIWARLMYAEDRAAEGMRQLFSDRAEGLSLLDSASDAYETLLNQLSAEQKNDPLVAGRVHLQLGRVKEAQEQFSAAAENFDKIIETWPESAVAERAQWSLDRLRQYKRNDFYTAFFAAPMPGQSQNGAMEMEGTQPEIPGFMQGGDPLEEVEGFNFESNFGEFESRGESTETPPVESEGETPVEGEGPATETPTVESPAAETPATETPATETPATETPATETPATDIPLEGPATDEPPAPPQ